MKRDEFIRMVQDDEELPIDLIRGYAFSAVVTMVDYVNLDGSGKRPAVLLATECSCCADVMLLAYIPDDGAIAPLAKRFGDIATAWGVQ